MNARIIYSIQWPALEQESDDQSERCYYYSNHESVNEVRDVFPCAAKDTQDKHRDGYLGQACSNDHLDFRYQGPFFKAGLLSKRESIDVSSQSIGNLINIGDGSKECNDL